VNPYAVRYGLGRAWAYTVLTFGMWLVFWFHRTRRLLDGELGGRREDAVLHSIGLLVPVWNILVLYWLYSDLDELRRRHRLPEIPVAAYVAGGGWLRRSCTGSPRTRVSRASRSSSWPSASRFG
jgi:hypothetical protein